MTFGWLGAGMVKPAAYSSAGSSPGVPFWFWSIATPVEVRICGPITRRYVPEALWEMKLTCRCWASVQLEVVICDLKSTAGPDVGVKVKLTTSAAGVKLLVSIAWLKANTTDDTGPATVPLGVLAVTWAPGGGGGGDDDT